VNASAAFLFLITSLQIFVRGECPPTWCRRVELRVASTRRLCYISVGVVGLMRGSMLRRTIYALAVILPIASAVGVGLTLSFTAQAIAGCSRC
jgi:hypothetical protein